MYVEGRLEKRKHNYRSHHGMYRNGERMESVHVVGMKRIAQKAALPVLALLALAGAAFPAAGCGERAVPREEVERIDEAFRRGTSHLAESTSFMVPLEKFDFENASFIEDVQEGIAASRSACMEIRKSLKELRAFDYSGRLEELGALMGEYSAAMEEAVEELEGVCGGLEEMMLAVEPTMREEAVITQLEQPGSDAEFLERLERLDAALGDSLSRLEGFGTPPALLSDYKSYCIELFTLLHSIVVDLKAFTLGQPLDTGTEDNPGFTRVRELLAGYPSLTEGIYGRLRIAGIDPLVEAVELEINRLYLGE